MKTNECRQDACAEFLSGSMSASEVSEFERHLGSCSLCQSELQRAAIDDELLRGMRTLISLTSGRSLRRNSSNDRMASSSPGSANRSPESTAATVLAMLSASDDPAVAGRLGQYDIHGIIGRGSAGIVLKGFDHSLHRNVAIKILEPSMADLAAARLRFSREAKAMAAVSCEYVVPIFEVSEHAGLPYLVMEYIPGGSLDKRLIDGGPVETEVAVRIGLQIAQALAAAHAQGLIHREIKPGNVLLDRGTERVRVADFGLVRTLNDASCTRSGVVTGTPQYMAPEQVRGEPCDAQSDLFSLGSVMYALCTGHAPFRAESVYGVMQRVVHDRPRPIREQSAKIPEWLDEFIQRLMEKRREARFGSAAMVAGILRTELARLNDPRRETEPVRDWRPSRMVKHSRIRRRTLIASVAGFISVVVLLATWQFLNPPFPKNDRIAETSSNAIPIRTGSPPFVPLWAEDGTRELQDKVRRIREEWLHAGNEPFLAADPDSATNSIRERLSKWKREDVPANAN